MYPSIVNDDLNWLRLRYRLKRGGAGRSIGYVETDHLSCPTPLYDRPHQLLRLLFSCFGMHQYVKATLGEQFANGRANDPAAARD